MNVFGGIVNCATIANGIVNASKSISLDLPLVVRLEGEGRGGGGWGGEFRQGKRGRKWRTVGNVE